MSEIHISDRITALELIAKRRGEQANALLRLAATCNQRADLLLTEADRWRTEGLRKTVEAQRLATQSLADRQSADQLVTDCFTTP